MVEYLCLYRVLEWADRANGTRFVAGHLDQLAVFNFGTLESLPDLGTDPIGVFERYRFRASERIAAMRAEGLDNEAIASRLYGLRNGLAHGKSRYLVHDFGADLDHVADQLPLVRLLARRAVATAMPGPA